MRKYQASEMEVLMYTSSIGAALDMLWMLCSGELRSGIQYCSTYPESARVFVAEHNNTDIVGVTEQDLLGDGTVLGMSLLQHCMALG
jgi:hypothetical protein